MIVSSRHVSLLFGRSLRIWNMKDRRGITNGERKQHMMLKKDQGVSGGVESDSSEWFKSQGDLTAMVQSFNGIQATSGGALGL